MRRAILIVIFALVAMTAEPAAARPTGCPSGSTCGQSVHFKSPSGNINCIGGTPPVFVECLVLHPSWPQALPRPIGCDLDWEAYNIGLARRSVTLGACRGDVGPRCFKDCTTLGYGKSVNIGPIRCRSAANGVTCRYVRGKLAGFRIAREGYVVWRT